MYQYMTSISVYTKNYKIRENIILIIGTNIMLISLRRVNIIFVNFGNACNYEYYLFIDIGLILVLTLLKT